MAPEQVLDEPLGPYTDIYATGVIAYELLAGHVPFEPDGPPLTTLYSHVHKTPPPLGDLAPDVPAPVCEWVGWLLSKAPDERPASAAAAWEALEEIAVPALGPYWRRRAPITSGTPGLPTIALARDEHRSPPRTPTTKITRRRHPRVRLATGAVAVIGAAAAVGYATLAGDPDTPAPAPSAAKAAKAPPSKPATAFDFDDDGKAELAFGMAKSGRDRAGVVVVMHGRRSEVIRPEDAGLDGPYDGREGFGRSIASGDFNGDGHADLAASAPGRARIAVIHGTEKGLRDGPVDSVRAGGVRLGGDYGTRMFGADMNRDGYDDLVLGAPEADPGPEASGVAQIVWGSERGLGTRTEVFRTDESLDRFGTALRVGDINGDGNLDLIEGAPDERGDGDAGTWHVLPWHPQRAGELRRR